MVAIGSEIKIDALREKVATAEETAALEEISCSRVHTLILKPF